MGKNGGHVCVCVCDVLSQCALECLSVEPANVSSPVQSEQQENISQIIVIHIIIIIRINIIIIKKK